jgi:hypothetical protein
MDKLISAFLLFFMLVGAGCLADDESTIVLASSYDQSCQNGSDCVPVDQNACAACNSCVTWDSAINTEAEAEFEAAKDAVVCGELDQTGCNNDCGGVPRAICVQSRCALWEGDPNQISRSCSSDAECLAVNRLAAERCFPDACPDFAVNKSAYETAIGIDCSRQTDEPGPEPSECSQPVEAACVGGTCALSR